MAILRGFPPSNTISPSVRITEKDLSFVTSAQSFHRAAIVGFAGKGPLNIPTMVSTTRQLYTTFGYPRPDVSDPYMLYAAEAYLNVGSELYVVRVGEEENVNDERAETASVDVPSAGDVITINSKDSGDYTVTEDRMWFKWKLNGVLSSKTLVIPAGTYSALELADLLNNQLDTNNDGIIFYATAGKIGVKTIWAYGPSSSLELVSVYNSIYGPESVIGLGTNMAPAEALGSEVGPFDLSASNLNLQVIVDGTDVPAIDNVVQVIDLSSFGSGKTAAQVVDQINDAIAGIGDYVNSGPLPGGFIAAVNDTNKIMISTLHSGRGARLRIKPDSTAETIFGLDTTTKVGESPVAVSSSDPGADETNTAGIVYGSENANNTDITFTISADSPGIEGNKTQVKILNDISNNTFTMQVFNNGTQVESWGSLTKDASSRLYVESYLSLVSDYIRVMDMTDTTSPPLDSTSFSPLDGVYTLTGGSDGIPSDPDRQDELLVGNEVGYTGLYSLSEPEQIDIDLVAVPGHSSTMVVTSLLNLCQNVRSDCLAIIDPPFGLTVKEIVQWQNGIHPLNLDRLDSDYGALYWPWVKIRDNHNNLDVWVPPSGCVMATIAASDNISEPWFAPAGLNRGVVSNILDVYSRPSLEERDQMYGNRNCINPIVQFVDTQGFVIFGQKTLQRRPTALDRINVRRLMFVLEKRIKSVSRSLLFDPHDDQFRSRFILLANSVLSEVKIKRGINDYIVKADAELNTPDVIDRNEFRARIGIQPIRAAEFIFIEFSIHRTGSFTENTETF